MAEVRTSSYNHVVQTPRIGGCTGAFFNLFDWNSKRFASTKRLPAERLEKSLRVRSKSFRDDRSAKRVAGGCSPSTRDTRFDGRDRGAVSDDEASSKAPGLVARLMGLESLPEPPVASKQHRRSRSFSGSDSGSHSERDCRGEKLALRDLLKQKLEPFENYCSGEAGGVYAQHKNRRVVRKPAAPLTPIKSESLVPYVDSPNGLCRSVYALPYVHRGEKSPFLARLHPSTVLQPSKCHNQMVSPAKASPGETKKRASRFLEVAVKILDEVSDTEVVQRDAVRPVAEFTPSSGFDLLHCRSTSKIWNGNGIGNDGTDSIGSRSIQSLMSRGSFSFRDSQRSDRICRDLFETSLSERAQSVSPPSRRLPRRERAPKLSPMTGRSILRTQEAAVGDFKKAPSPSPSPSPKTNSKSRFTDSVQTVVKGKRMSRHADASALSDGSDFVFTSDEESLTDQLVRLASSGTAVTRESKAAGVSSFRSSPAKGRFAVGEFGNSTERSFPLRHEEAVSPLESLHEGLRPIRLQRSRCGLQESAVAVPSSRARPSELAKPRSAALPRGSQLFFGQTDVVKLSVRIKREKQVQSTAAQCLCPLPNAPPPRKRSRRKSRHGSAKFRESSGLSRGMINERRSLSPHLERRKHHNARNSTDSEHSYVSDEILGDAFPDIALPDSRKDGNAVDELIDDDADSRDENLYETSDSDILYGHEKGEHGQGLGRDFVEVADRGDPALEELILGMDDLHWDDGMVAQQRENFPSRARYCEIRASGESVQSICGAALDEDVCNVDDGSSRSPQQFGGEMSSEADKSSAPVLMNLLLGKPLKLDVDMGEASPVSVLDSPFGDSEVCTTSESSIPESERQEAGKSDLEQTTETTSLTAEHESDPEQLELVSSPRDSTTPVDKVRQAILDITAFRSLDHDRAAAVEATQASPQTEKTFVREVLSAAQLLSSPGRSPNWYERDLAVDPSLFEKLEDGDAAASGFSCESGGMWRCDRKLLFDCVNEAFSQNVRHFRDPQPWFRRPVLRSRSVRQKLVEEVQEKINGWRELASHAIDTLIDIDMSTRSGMWSDFGEEVAEMGAEIESMVWEVMVEEVVLELAGRSRN